jgi:hypothetical protein
MPFLDLSEVFFDPDFLDTTLTCTRNLQGVGQDGVAFNQASTNPFNAIVTSDSGAVLKRVADGSHIVDTIMVHTLTRLIDGQSGYDADVITWSGANWTVTNVMNYSTYGPGFVCAICTLVQLAGSA